MKPPTSPLRLLQAGAACLALTAVAAGCSSDPETAEAPVSTVVDAEGDDPAFTEIDVDDETVNGAGPTDSDASSGDSGSDAGSATSGSTTSSTSTGGDTDEPEASSGGSASGGSDTGGTSSSGGSGSGASTPSPNGDDDGSDGPTPDVEDLTPDEIEDDEDLSIDDPDVREAVEEAEEEFRNRPEAEPGEVDLANADVTFETRYLGGRLTGATGSESVELGSIVAYSVVTDLDDILTLDGTDLREPTRADSAQLVFRADTAGTFTLLLEDSGVALFEIVVS